MSSGRWRPWLGAARPGRGTSARGRGRRQGHPEADERTARAGLGGAARVVRTSRAGSPKWPPRITHSASASRLRAVVGRDRTGTADTGCASTPTRCRSCRRGRTAHSGQAKLPTGVVPVPSKFARSCRGALPHGKCAVGAAARRLLPLASVGSVTCQPSPSSAGDLRRRRRRRLQRRLEPAAVGRGRRSTRRTSTG